MKYLLYILSFTAMSFVSLGSDTTGTSRINISYALLHYYDNKNVDNDGLIPGLLTAKNTSGYYFGLEYERITRFGLILNGGLHIGLRKHDINIYEDLSHFDSSAVNNLKGAFFEKNIQLAFYYIDPGIRIGYRLHLGNTWALLAKAGIFKTIYMGGKVGEEYAYLSYSPDSSNSYGTNARFLGYEIFIGEAQRDRRNPSLLRPASYFRGMSNIYECYIGVERSLQKSIIKNISFGVEACRTTRWRYSPNFLYINAAANVYSKDMGNAHLFDRNVSIGARLAVGLWK